MNFTDSKKNTGPGVIGKPSPMYNHLAAANQYPHQQRMYMPQNHDNSVQTFVQGFGGLNIRGNPQCPAQAPPAFLHNGQVVFASNYVPQQSYNGISQSPGMFSPTQMQFVNSNQGAFQHNFAGHSPMSHAWTSRATSAEVPPTLITPRRDSSSSNEIEAPGTPFTTYTGFGEFQPGVAVLDRSPHSLYAYSTPSPSDAIVGYSGQSKTNTENCTPLEIKVLCAEDPPIPRGIPATGTPPKPLNRCLENQNGVTNVYIRGLLPETSDEKLFAMARRFGEIDSSKSIIDHSTGLCKGFGFVKFYNYKDAESCIRGFYYMGYETSFARESFYAQLKKLQDDGNTNLYVSNLPKDMSEHELSAIFGPHKVCSSRILRDSAGNGRGVGFARFETRDICEEIVKDYNNTPVAKQGGEEHLIQIRYADSKEQKVLKQQTTAARQYRTAEYEFATQSRSRFLNNGLQGVPNATPGYETEFENYLSNATSGGNLPCSQPAARFTAHDRLNTVSSHLVPSTAGLNGSPLVGRSDKSQIGIKDEDDVKSTVTAASGAALVELNSAARAASESQA